MKLLIVESPSKAKTLDKYLSNFKVLSTYGHFLKLRKTRPIDENFNISYSYTLKGKKIIDIIKNTIEKFKISDNDIYIATDYDREGEMIANQIVNELKINNFKNRIILKVIDKKNLLNSLKKPILINKYLVLAQETRVILDRKIGYDISPILWKIIESKLSAGRVQTPALIFIYELYLKNLSKKKEKKFSLYDREKKININLLDLKNNTNFEYINNIFKNLNSIISFKCDGIKKKDKILYKNKFLITTDLISFCFNLFGFSANKTMNCAQELFEGIALKNNIQKGLITYHRTDSRRIDKDFILETKKFLKTNYSSADISLDNFKKDKKKIDITQDAHECIRPSDLTVTPDILEQSNINSDVCKVYKFIYFSYLSSFLNNINYTEYTFTFKDIEKKLFFEIKKYYFEKKNNFSILKNSFELNKTLRNINNNFFVSKIENIDKLKDHVTIQKSNLYIKSINLNKIIYFNESSIIKKLKENNIGRPSTYSTIIPKLLLKNYIYISKKKLIITELGIISAKLLKKYYLEIFDSTFTEKLENNLSLINENKLNKLDFLKDIYRKIEEKNNIFNIFIKKFFINLKEYENFRCFFCYIRIKVSKGFFGYYINCINCRKKYPLSFESLNNIFSSFESEENKNTEKLIYCKSKKKLSFEIKNLFIFDINNKDHNLFFNLNKKIIFEIKNKKVNILEKKLKYTIIFLRTAGFAIFLR